MTVISKAQLKLSGRKKTCKRCGFTAPEEWFIKSGSLVRETAWRRTFCPMCLQELKDKRKRANRAVAKARAMLYNHAKKYGFRASEFKKKYGWDINQMIHDIEHSFENWCSYCGEAYNGMGHGLADLTLDIINPNEPPYYTNIRYCCATCNKSKGQRGANEFGFHLAMVKQRREFLNSKDGTFLKPQHLLPMIFGDGDGEQNGTR